MIFENSSRSPGFGSSPSRFNTASRFSSINLFIVNSVSADPPPLSSPACGGDEGRRTSRFHCVLRGKYTLTRLRDNIDYRWLAALDDLDGFVQGRAELIGIRNRSKAIHVKSPRKGRQIRRRLFDADADALVLERALARSRHTLLVLFVVVVRPVVEHNREQRNLVLGRGPEGVGRHQEITIAYDSDAQTTAF